MPSVVVVYVYHKELWAKHSGLERLPNMAVYAVWLYQVVM